MLLFSSCKSNRIKARDEIKFDVYFPAPPYPKDGLIIPVKVQQKNYIDKDTYIVCKVVNDKDTEVVYDMVPHWWLVLVADYMSKTEAAIEALDID